MAKIIRHFILKGLEMLLHFLLMLEIEQLIPLSFGDHAILLILIIFVQLAAEHEGLHFFPESVLHLSPLRLLRLLQGKLIRGQSAWN